MNKLRFFTVFIFSLLVTCSLQLASSYAESDILAVEKPFLEGRYDRAAYEAKRMIDERCRMRHEVYYIKGLSELKLGRYKDARQSFGEIVSRYPKSERAFDAYAGIGDSYFLEGNMESALKAYAEAKTRFPSDKNAVMIDSRINDCRAKGVSPLPPAITGNNAAEIEDVRIIPDRIPQNESKGFISVQAGCFKNHRNAEKFSVRLKSAGYESYVELPLASGDNLYRVKVGRFKTRNEAESIATKLNRDGYRTKICDDSTCQ
ncbi:MAG: SPOR domain-containing protein [Candidatus Omnitrophota bacterium]